MVILRDHIDTIEKYRLDRVLPGPDRQGEIVQWPKIGIEHQGQGVSKSNRHKPFPSFRGENTTYCYFLPTPSIGATLISLRANSENTGKKTLA